jgi:DnaJ domain
MSISSRLFDRIRIRSAPEPEPEPTVQRCAHPGCTLPGEFRAPMGRHLEGQYFYFCLEHVRAYNARYNYFTGMNDQDVAGYHNEAAYGHRPTWAMGTRRASAHDGQGFTDAAPAQQARSSRHQAHTGARARPRMPLAVVRALDCLGLDEAADAGMIRARYKELVKRFHPDANGGDRSSEERLRAILQAYKNLQAARLV